MVALKNNNLTVEINPHGAELWSVTGADGFAYLWQGDPAVWAGRAPVLFPIVGGLRDDVFYYCGKPYHLPKHGFARTSDFTVETLREDSAVFLLRSNESTKQSYPFDFAFRVGFRLCENRLAIEYRVDNTDDKEIYFSFGAHEAYACAGGIEGYQLEFPAPETLSRLMVDGNLLNGKAVPVMENSRILPLKNRYFEDDALIFKAINSKQVTLTGFPGARRVTVDYPGFSQLLVWTKPGAEYICIEPWDGIPDSVGCKQDITKKEGIVALQPGKTYALTHTVTFQ